MSCRPYPEHHGHEDIVVRAVSVGVNRQDVVDEILARDVIDNFALGRHVARRNGRGSVDGLRFDLCPRGDLTGSDRNDGRARDCRRYLEGVAGDRDLVRGDEAGAVGVGHDVDERLLAGGA